MATPTLGRPQSDTSTKSARLQPSIFDDSIFGEYICSLVKNAVGNWEPAVKTNVSQNRCRVFRKSPWWNLSCDDDVWLREQATMNRALFFRRSQDNANRTSNDIRPVR